MSNSKYEPSLSYLRPEVAVLKLKLDEFVENECIRAEAEYEAHMATRSGADRWTLSAIPPCMDRLKRRAQQLGLWNLFVPPHLLSHVPVELRPSVPLSFREYGVLCESLGRCPHIAPEACNTSAPDTGNMEVLMEFGTPQQKQRYLLPLLRGEIRSCFCMTEPDVASSDPTNLQTRLSQATHGALRLDGRKWWSTGAMDPRCRVALVVARRPDPGPDPHDAQVLVAVPLPHPGVRMERALTVAGYDDAPHGHAEVEFTNVRLKVEDLIPGSGFQVAQARLGPGRIHHCMRAVGIGK
jgi:acyl-CoA dehydrogenase